ncbi:MULTISPECIES: hypothetical protein [unclassified Erythrobacter]|uniref:hypothetical protein n=1 Tax=unclassified Erythrobacter TaxID=2633097 RepID=UPI0007BA84A5|nr:MULTISPECIES: hypothetical protein [unclassified Erythrobacter]KZY91379.1 hypothetical protein A3745_04940 [Erythrobacter sp. HI0074]KZZ09143.1 hypothetical protein A3748_09235 [Erythrobacter sp. HI0077]
MVEGILTGLRIGASILWVSIAVRVMIESWHVTEQPAEIRKRGWSYWRAMLLVMAFVIVCLFSPENILRAHGYITEQTGFWLMSAGVIGLHICAYLTLIGLDIATGQGNRAWPAYLLISIVSLTYGVTRGMP